MTDTVLLRCAGSARIGLGHVMRAVAVGEAARARGARVILAVTDDPIAVSIARARGFAVQPVADGLDPDAEARALTEDLPPGSWAVLDGYALGDRVEPLARRRLRVCLIDDTPVGMASGPAADLWVRPGLALAAPSARALCGLRYAPLRAEFRQARLHPPAGSARIERPRIAVLSGGSDAGDLLARVLDCLSVAADRLPPLEIEAIVGPAAPVPQLPPGGPPVRVLRAPADLVARLMGAALAITAAGTTILELLCLGTPPLMLAVVDNQRGVPARIAAHGGGVDLGEPRGLSPGRLCNAITRVLEHRPRFSEAGRRLVDGGGARRLLAVMGAGRGGRA